MMEARKSLIDRIVDRAHRNVLPLINQDPGFTRKVLIAVDLDFDINWSGLANSEDQHFIHDVMGMLVYYNPAKGTFNECWFPRYGKNANYIDFDQEVDV